MVSVLKSVMVAAVVVATATITASNSVDTSSTTSLRTNGADVVEASDEMVRSHAPACKWIILRFGFDFYGNDMESHPADNFEQCCILAQKSPSFTYNYNTRRCYLKSGNGKSKVVDCDKCVSGYWDPFNV